MCDRTPDFATTRCPSKSTLSSESGKRTLFLALEFQATLLVCTIARITDWLVASMMRHASDTIGAGSSDELFFSIRRESSQRG